MRAKSSRSLQMSALILQTVISSDSISLPGVTISSPNSESRRVTTPPCFKPTCLTQSLGRETVSVEWPTRWTFLISNNLSLFDQMLFDCAQTKARFGGSDQLYISPRFYIEKGPIETLPTECMENVRATYFKKVQYFRAPSTEAAFELLLSRIHLLPQSRASYCTLGRSEVEDRNGRRRLPG